MAGFLLDSKGGEIYILTALAGHSTSVLDPVGSKTIKKFWSSQWQMLCNSNFLNLAPRRNPRARLLEVLILKRKMRNGALKVTSRKF